MPTEEDAAAAKLQAIKRGQKAREDVKQAKAARKVQSMQRGKKARKGGEQLLKAISTLNYPLLERLLAEGAEPDSDVLRAALAAPSRAFASRLIVEQSAWGVEPKQLAVWNEVQSALSPAAGEDEEEPEEADVAGEEWQASTAAKVFGADPEGVYLVKQVVTLGAYAGARAEADEVAELAFDTEVTAREGYGVALMPKGAVYAGDFAAGAREGVGVYRYTDGTCYCGEWKGNAKHGAGRMAYKDGAVYEGGWRFNKRHGHGVYTYPNGDVYVGMWFTGAKHGAGKYRSAELGSRFAGVWANGALVSSSVTSQDGARFFSGFASGVPVGAGVFTSPGGALFKGEHVMAPLDEGIDEEEAAAAVRSSTWVGGAVGDADHMTAAVLGVEYGSAAAKPLAKALILGVEYPAEGGAFPPLDNAPAAAQLKGLCTGTLKMAEGDVTVLEAEKHTKEAVLEALGELAGKVGRGDVAFVALVCHGKKLLDADNDELEDKEEGLCLADEVLSSDELGEVIAKFGASSAHLFLYLDSCFDGACLASPPPNFACLTASLDAYEKPPEGGAPSWSTYFGANMTSWLAPALEMVMGAEGMGAKPPYGALLEAVQLVQSESDSRAATKQLPKLYCRDAADAVLKPMA